MLAEQELSDEVKHQLAALLHDRMTQTVLYDVEHIELFAEHEPAPLQRIAIIEQGQEALIQACSTEHPDLVFSVVRMPLSQATAAELPFEAANADENERWAGTVLKQLGQIAQRLGFHLLRVG